MNNLIQMIKSFFTAKKNPVKEMERAIKIVAFNGRCVDEDGCCVYDNGEGKHCIIGQFIVNMGLEAPNGRGEIEVRELAKMEKYEEFFSPFNIDKLIYLQEYHDHRMNWELKNGVKWEDHAYEYLKENGLYNDK